MGTVGLRTKCDPPVVSSSDNRAERYDWPGRRHDGSLLLMPVSREAGWAVWAAGAAESDMMEASQIESNPTGAVSFLARPQYFPKKCLSVSTICGELKQWRSLAVLFHALPVDVVLDSI